jgi:hypothetical protein
VIGSRIRPPSTYSRIDGLRAALGLLPIVLKRPPALKLRLVDLVVAVQPA